MTADKALFQSVIDNTVTTSDGQGMLSPELPDTMEAAYLRHVGNAEMEALFEAAVNAYGEASLAASADL
jgi:transcriptional regulator of acetoin/glycerol metabolism